nr:hypothetical protein [Brevundimonas diminuta]
MALLEVRSFAETILELPSAEEGLERWNHVLEPEFHQARYVNACLEASQAPLAFRLDDLDRLERLPSRGMQPSYADDDTDPDSLSFHGMIDAAGKEVDGDDGKRNICALKSVSVRWGYVDYSVARSVTPEFAASRGKRAAVQRNDLLINSTGDGTIGRVAVYDEDFPAVVDGHVTIVRFKDPDLAWFTAAYLLTQQGQDQIYRYINGSSGQVEIYPQDIARIWVPLLEGDEFEGVVQAFREAARKHRAFYKEMRAALNLLEPAVAAAEASTG